VKPRPRILLTGRDGQVGWELRRTLAPIADVTALARAELDLTDVDAVRAIVRTVKPNYIVNAAAYTAVDRAEQEETLAQAINGDAPGILADEAERLGASMLHFSTDYVFAGNKPDAYVEADVVGPLSAYGRTKLDGERRVLAAGARHAVFRTSWVYGARGKNFLLTMLRLANERPQLRVVVDQFGAPTWSRMIANGIAAYVQTVNSGAVEAGGLFHLTAGGATSWHGFAARIVEWGAQRGLCKAVPVEAIGTSDYPTPARRPQQSALANVRLNERFGIALPDWESSLALCLDELIR